MITIYIIIIIYFDLIAGCGSLWITDGIWKTVFPHCMFRVEVSCYSYTKGVITNRSLMLIHMYRC